MAFLRQPANTIAGPAAEARYLLWMDGVGAYLLCLGDRVTIGGHRPDGKNADVPLLANLSRTHATFRRGAEGYVLEAQGPVKVAGRTVKENAWLTGDRELDLGNSVRLRFRMPSVLSATATIDFLSDHRPAHSLDGIILMEDNCLLGPGSDNHVRCLNWPETVLLYRRGDQLWCKSRSDVFVEKTLARSGCPLKPGNVVTGNDLRFRLEPAPW
jgi:hypothetical protein